jgi:hypothetical protein
MAELSKKYISLCLFFFLLFFVIMPHGGFGFDIWCFQEWAVYIFQHGLKDTYNSGTDYLPLFHYILKIYGYFQGSVDNILNNIHYLKSITLIFLFVTGFFIALIIKTAIDRWDVIILKITVFYLINIAILYNTVIWGQVDAILTCMVFIACYFAFKKRVLFSLIFILLAINFKLQAIIFVPIVGLLIIPVIISSYSIKNIVKWILIPLFMQILIILPFIMSETLPNLWGVVTGSFGKYPFISMNAFNMWDLLLPGEDLRGMLDNIQFLKVSYKNWGLGLFFISSGIALFPLAKYGYLSITKKIELKIPLEQFLIVCALIPLLFFYFNTQMHERYSDPTFAFLIAYAIYKNKPVVATIGCLAYFLNLEAVLHFMQLYNYKTLIFNRKFISFLFLLTILMLYADLYHLQFKIVKKQLLPKTSDNI